MNIKTIFLTAIALVMIGCAVSNRTEVPAVQSPRIIAHRGGCNEYDDNALGAFRRSLAYGITAFETDVRVTADGELVLMHDADVARTTVGTGRVDKLSLASFRKLKLRKCGECAPSLEDLLAIVGGQKGLWVEFEMKSSGPLSAEEYCRKLYDKVTSSMPAGTYAFTSFDTKLLSAMIALNPNVPTSLLSEKPLDDTLVDTACKLGVSGVSPVFKDITVEAVAKAKGAGKRVTLWMVQDGAQYRKAREVGADAIISDDPIMLMDSCLVMDAKAKDPSINTALIPVARLERDSYMWFDRHELIMSKKTEINPEIVFVGDSITHFWAGRNSVGGKDAMLRWKKAFGRYRTLNLGFGWDRTGNVLKRLDMGEMDGLSPKVIVLHIGGNNYTKTANYPGDGPKDVAEANVEIVDRLHRMVPNARIIVMATFPFGYKPGPGHREQHPIGNAIIKAAMARRDYVSFYDITDKQLAPDGTYPKELSKDSCHPTDRGYDIWSEAILPEIERVLHN